MATRGELPQESAGIITPASAEAPATRGGPPPAVRLALVAVGMVALILLAMVAIRYFEYSGSHQTTDDAQIDADQVQITSKISERVSRILVDTNQQVSKGQVLIQLDDRDERERVLQAQASRSALVAQARAAQENVTLARDTQSAQDRQASGTIAQAQASIASAAEQARSQQSQISVSQAGIDSAAAQVRVAQDGLPGAYQNLQRARADLARTSSLVKTGDIAAAQLDSARASYEAARSQYTQAQAGVSAAQANLDQARQRLLAQRASTGSSEAQIGIQKGTLTTAQGRLEESSAPSRIAAQQAQADAATAQIASALAILKTAQDQLSYTQIRSPIDGYVGAKNVDAGQTVQPGESLLAVVPSNNIYVTANFKETQIGKMRPGQEVDLAVDAYKGVNFVGRVRAISPASQNRFSLVPAQNATGNFVKVTQRVPVRIVFERPDPAYPLRPGMSVEASVKVK